MWYYSTLGSRVIKNKKKNLAFGTPLQSDLEHNTIIMQLCFICTTEHFSRETLRSNFGRAVVRAVVRVVVRVIMRAVVRAVVRGRTCGRAWQKVNSPTKPST